MIITSEPLITLRFTESEFKRASVLNAGVTIKGATLKAIKKAKKNKMQRKNNLARARKTSHY